MNREALADRFISYSDAISVFPFVQAVAFSIGLSDPDTRCSIAEIWAQIVLGNFVFIALMTAAVFIFRRAELSLRESQALDPIVSRYLRRLYIGRIAIIWMSFTYLALSAYSASFDVICLSDVAT